MQAADKTSGRSSTDCIGASARLTGRIHDEPGMQTVLVYRELLQAEAVGMLAALKQVLDHARLGAAYNTG